MNSKKIKINEYNILGVIIQGILTLVALIFCILALVRDSKYFLFLEITVAVDLLVMAYNNKKIYKRDKMTKIYMIFGIVMVIYVLMTILGVK
mgnify:CR=1 FL=1